MIFIFTSVLVQRILANLFGNTNENNQHNEKRNDSRKKRVYQEKKNTPLYTPNTKNNMDTIKIVCVNDVYTFQEQAGIGGWPRATTAIRSLVKGHEDHCLVTANGDLLGGASLLQHSKGMAAVDILNNLPIDVAVVGNHEFDYGEAEFRNCVKNSKFKWFGSNVIDKSTGKMMDGLYDTHVWTVPANGLRVGLFGVCTLATPTLSYPGDNVEFRDCIETARQSVEKLRQEENVDVVIALTHITWAQDKELAASVPGIDVILGGHDHDPYALYQHKCLLFKCGQNAYWIGVVDLCVEYQKDEDGTPLKNSIKIHPSWHMHTTRHTPPADDCKKIIEEHQLKADKAGLVSMGAHFQQPIELHDVLATLATNSEALDTRTGEVRMREATSGMILADAIFEFFKDAEPDFAVINGGFIRGDRLYPPGTDITVRDVLQELPFPRAATCLEILGQYVKDAFEQHLSLLPAATGSYPHVTKHIYLEYDDRLPQGKRVTKLLFNGKPLIDTKKYRIVLTEFMANGGDGCSAWSYGIVDRRTVPARRISHILIWYLSQLATKKSLVLKKQGRVKDIGDK
eukprot:m.7347 g.7347  ORF g.7347 m.7347 type:complete len:570 (-) comp3701_c0_seq1:63-1772(-)